MTEDDLLYNIFLKVIFTIFKIFSLLFGVFLVFFNSFVDYILEFCSLNARIHSLEQMLEHLDSGNYTKAVEKLNKKKSDIIIIYNI